MASKKAKQATTAPVTDIDQKPLKLIVGDSVRYEFRDAVLEVNIKTIQDAIDLMKRHTESEDVEIEISLKNGVTTKLESVALLDVEINAKDKEIESIALSCRLDYRRCSVTFYGNILQYVKVESDILGKSNSDFLSSIRSKVIAPFSLSFPDSFVINNKITTLFISSALWGAYTSSIFQKHVGFSRVPWDGMPYVFALLFFSPAIVLFVIGDIIMKHHFKRITFVIGEKVRTIKNTKIIRYVVYIIAIATPMILVFGDIVKPFSGIFK